MDVLDLYSSIFDTDEKNILKVPEVDYNKFEAQMTQLNSDCAINDAESWKAASEIVLTD